MKYQVHRVHGAQAEMALHDLGLVKITEASARDLFDLGVPLVIAPSKVNSHHFFGGWGLAMHLDSQRYFNEANESRRVGKEHREYMRGKRAAWPAHLRASGDDEKYDRIGEEVTESIAKQYSFDSIVGNWRQYNENSETGKAAFFVDQKYVVDARSGGGRRFQG